MAKVILADNLNREEIPDKLLAESLTDEEADIAADQYNDERSEADPYFAIVVPDDYKLR